MQIVEIPVEHLHAHQYNPRLIVSEDHLQELAGSISLYGMIHVPTVRPHPTISGEYQILSGHNRIEAARRCGWMLVPCDIRTCDDVEADIILLESNFKQRSLNEIEEGRAMQRLQKTYGWTQEEIAQRFAKTQSWVSRRISLAENLTLPVQNMVMSHVIEPTAAREIAEVPEDVQESVAREVVEHDLSVAEVSDLTNRLKRRLRETGILPDQAVAEAIDEHFRAAAVPLEKLLRGLVDLAARIEVDDLAAEPPQKIRLVLEALQNLKRRLDEVCRQLEQQVMVDRS